jgi:D-tyrosyl-tRNA(Tyr) deacylase
MRAVVQKCLHSSVVVDNAEVARIGPGLMVLLAVKKGDDRKDAEYMMDKIINLRIFEDEQEKMNLSLLDTEGELLLVSQFTLCGDARKGRRPSFSEAEDPVPAKELFAYCAELGKSKNIRVETGVFAAHMQVNICNDGPCTILLDSEKTF